MFNRTPLRVAADWLGVQGQNEGVALARDAASSRSLLPVSEGHAPEIADRTLAAVGGAVRITDLEKHYGSVAAVAGLSLDLKAGEFTAILGPSGSGKTTVLMCMAGFEHPDRGDIFVDGRSVTGIPTNRRNIGMVFQRYALFPHMTVAENIAFPLRMRRIKKQRIADLVRKTLDNVRLSGLEGRMPSQLSGGQQQRVALARALVYEPPLLLLDEPLSALDKKLREEMQIELKELHQRLGITMVFVTHDQQEALTMADRIAVMNEGRLEQVGRPNELYEEPATEFVAGFLGESNRLVGRFQPVDAALGFAAVNGSVRLPGHTLAGDSIANGDCVALMVRPEKVRLNGQNQDGHAARGRVEKVIYSGATTAYVIRLDQTNTVTARVATSHGGAHAINAGDEVTVGWRAQDARLFGSSEPLP